MKKNLSVAAIGTALMVILMRWQGSSLKTDISKKGIVDLEFADTRERMHELLMRWDTSVVKMNIWLDFLFIVAYVLLLSIAAELCAAKWTISSTPQKIGVWMARAAYVAGVFDIAENLLMLQTVAGNYTNTSLELTFYCASIKFILVGLVFFYCIISIPVVFRKNK
jgi:hypothetical protein